MSQTIMLVFTGQGRELHLPVQQVEITPSGVITENGKIASVAMSPGIPMHYRLIKSPFSGEAQNYGDETYDSIRVYRLMPTGAELEKALEQFETDMLLRDEAPKANGQLVSECPECRGIGDHRCAWREPVTKYVCGIAKVNHEGVGHRFVRCLHATVSRH